MYENLHPDVRAEFQAMMDAIYNSNREFFPMAINPLDFSDDNVKVSMMEVPGYRPEDPQVKLYIFQAMARILHKGFF